MNRLLFWCGVVALMTSLLVPLVPARAAEEPDLIFKRSTVFKWLTPNEDRDVHSHQRYPAIPGTPGGAARP